METIYKLVCMSLELLTHENNNMASQQGAKRPFVTPKLGALRSCDHTLEHVSNQIVENGL